MLVVYLASSQEENLRGLIVQGAVLLSSVGLLSENVTQGEPQQFM